MTPYALYRLERAGIKVIREVHCKKRDFQAVLRLKQAGTHLSLIKWINSVHQTSFKPTWKTLFLVLCLIDLDHLTEEIYTYLSGGTVKQLSEGTSASMCTEQDLGTSQKTTEGMYGSQEGKLPHPQLVDVQFLYHSSTNFGIIMMFCLSSA